MSSSSLLLDDIDDSDDDDDDDQRVRRDESNCLNLDNRAVREGAALLLLRDWLPFVVGILNFFLKVNYI